MSSTFSPGEHLVYVVDAANESRRETSGLLSRAGFQCRAFASAEALLESVDSERPSCIVSEMILPGMSAIDLTHSLRSRDCMVPIIVLARQDDVETAVAALRSSVADYLIRPFADRDLIQRLRLALQRQDDGPRH